MTIFAKQKNQILRLNTKYDQYWRREFGSRNTDYIANPENFTVGIYFHQANSPEDKLLIIKSGFNHNLVSKENMGMGLGAGLYAGRDKRALINFYSADFNNPIDNTVVIRGNFNFFDAVSNPLPQNGAQECILSQGYDGIRYYDPDATGEEFVLFNYSKIAWNT